jgi:hypothetical protein
MTSQKAATDAVAQIRRSTANAGFAFWRDEVRAIFFTFALSKARALGRTHFLALQLLTDCGFSKFRQSTETLNAIAQLNQWLLRHQFVASDIPQFLQFKIT